MLSFEWTEKDTEKVLKALEAENKRAKVENEEMERGKWGEGMAHAGAEQLRDAIWAPSPKMLNILRGRW